MMEEEEPEVEEGEEGEEKLEGKEGEEGEEKLEGEEGEEGEEKLDGEEREPQRHAVARRAAAAGRQRPRSTSAARPRRDGRG